MRRRFSRSISSKVTGSVRASSSSSSGSGFASSSARKTTSGGGAEPRPLSQALKYIPVPPHRMGVRPRVWMSRTASVASSTNFAASNTSDNPTTSKR